MLSLLRSVETFRVPYIHRNIATIPEFIWELSLGIYLIVKGFKPCPILGAA